MDSTRLLIIFLLPILYLFMLTAAQPEFLAHVCEDTYGNYTPSSTFKANLDTLLSSISTKQIDYGFYNFSVGQGLDAVDGFALCRADVTAADCHSCRNYAVKRIRQDCPNQKTAIGWYDNCMIRYSDLYLLKDMHFGPYFNETNGYNVSDVKEFNRVLLPLLGRLQNQTASGNSRLKFATGEENVTSSLKIYAMMQCFPDQPAYDCFTCLNMSNEILQECCVGELGAKVFAGSCSVRYENYLFYNTANVLLPSPPPLTAESSPPQSSPSTTNAKGVGSRKHRNIIYILVPAVIFVLSMTLLCCYLIRGRKIWVKVKGDGETRSTESLQIHFNTIRAATDNFSAANELGQGGFGTVYKGVLANGQAIAVKRLAKTSGQGEQEFKNEVLLVAKLQHRNLVRLLGFSLEGEERLLVYEFLPNKSLDYFLFDPVNCLYLDWEKRHKIIEGISRGLLYLHEDSRLLVVHRDLKASNILLDQEMNPKISDFGMARLFGADQTQGYASKIVGTYGYMPPEYVLHGRFSIRSDVYSFGVLMLEIISGQRISSFCKEENSESLLGFAWRNWLEGTALSIVDPTMQSVNMTEILRCINIALLCVQENVAHRPIMSAVVLMLSSSTVTLPVPSRPAFLMHVEPEQSVILEYDVSLNEASISELDPR